MTAVQRQDDEAETIRTLQRELKALQRAVLGVSGGGGSFSALALGSNFAAFGGEWAGPTYFQDAAGFVHLRGLVKSTGTVTYGNGSSALIGTLPVGFRPSASPEQWELFTCWGEDTNTGNKTVYRVQVQSNGGIYAYARLPNGSTAYSVGTVGYVTLGGISFPAG